MESRAEEKAAQAASEAVGHGAGVSGGAELGPDPNVPVKDGRTHEHVSGPPDWANDAKIELTWEQVAALAFQAAGAGAAAIMCKEGPPREVVMPTQEIGRDVDKLLREIGVDIARIHGYGSTVEDRHPPAHHPV